MYIEMLFGCTKKVYRFAPLGVFIEETNGQMTELLHSSDSCGTGIAVC